jgi:ElaB/YqjD/DUF883 family membrane-anchored ribosome-binding protein
MEVNFLARKKEETDIEDIKATLLELKTQLSTVEQDFMNDLKTKAKRAEQKFEEKVGEHPLRSTGIAFGVGALTGAIVYGLLKKK